MSAEQEQIADAAEIEEVEHYSWKQVYLANGVSREQHDEF